MSYRFYKLKVLVIILCIFTKGLSTDIGSDTTVNQFTAQQTLNDGDRVASFAALKAGFVLADELTTATFDSVFPVSGDVDLNAGALYLSRDLVLDTVSSSLALGNIIGNNQSVQLSSLVDITPGDEKIIKLTSVSAFNNGDWSYDGKFLAVGVGTSTLSIYEFDGKSLVFKYSVSVGNIINEIAWHPTEYLLAYGGIVGTGYEFGIYQVDNNGSLTFRSGKDITYVVESVNWHPSGDYLAIAIGGLTDDIYVYEVTNQGGTLAFKCSYSTSGIGYPRTMRWHKNGVYLAYLSHSFASGAKILEFDYSNPGACTLTYVVSESIGSLVGFRYIEWSDEEDYILARGGTGSPNAYLDIFDFSPTASTLTSVANKDIYGDHFDWQPGENRFAITYDSSNLTNIYDFNPTTSAITLFQNISGSSDYLPYQKYSPNGLYLAGGALMVYGPDAEDFYNVNLFLNGNTFFNGAKIKFNGESSIDGMGNRLNLDVNSKIIIDSAASLCLKNIIIDSVIQNSIYCIDNTSTLSVENCTWILNDDYIFDQGHLEIFGDVKIVGDGYTFNYTTTQESIIGSNATLILDNNVTFRYDPSTSDRDLINLYDNTSSIVLSGATLFSSDAGLRLTKGNLLVERSSILACDGTTNSDGISFGDGSSSANDLNIEFVGAANLDITSGYVGYNNVSG